VHDARVQSFWGPKTQRFALLCCVLKECPSPFPVPLSLYIPVSVPVSLSLNIPVLLWLDQAATRACNTIHQSLTPRFGLSFLTISLSLARSLAPPLSGERHPYANHNLLLRLHSIRFHRLRQGVQRSLAIHKNRGARRTQRMPQKVLKLLSFFFLPQSCRPPSTPYIETPITPPPCKRICHLLLSVLNVVGLLPNLEGVSLRIEHILVEGNQLVFTEEQVKVLELAQILESQHSTIFTT
jgi:hypothetical protein